MIPVTTFRRRTVAVFGLGGSGLAAAQALLAGGARVAAWDDNAQAREKAVSAGIPVVDLGDVNWSKLSALVLAPGVPLTHPVPHWTVEKAMAARVPVIGDVELFLRERARQCPTGPFVAVTGTNGKSTTTALIAHLLHEDGRDVQLGGNIGTPILALEPFHLARFYVIELSSFQIDLSPSLKKGLGPSVGVLLNITPDHIDRHGTLESYAAIKERVADGAEQVVIGVDDDLCRAIAGRIGSSRFVFGISTNENHDGGYHLVGSKLRFDSDAHKMHEEMADLANARALRGRHNGQNALAAVAALSALGSALAHAGIHPLQKKELSLQRRFFEPVPEFLARIKADAGRTPPAEDLAERRRQALQTALDSFPGLPHRLEEIGRLGRVAFFNDSKATNADSTEKALATFEGGIHWIVGGRQKEGGITSLAPYFPKIAKAYLIGESAEAFAATLSGQVQFDMSGTLEEALAAAVRDAVSSRLPEPVVLLSPACASYDQYKNFEVRGDAFRHLVSQLPGVELRRRSG